MSQHSKSPQTLEEGYNKFVIKNKKGCWGWKGCMPSNPGYGQFRHMMKLERAHRASWIIHNGDIPSGMSVLHKCDNKECSNPDHLFLGSQKDNMIDMIKKNRNISVAQKGFDSPLSKFTPEDVSNIHSLKKDGKSSVFISKIFNVSSTTILRVVNGVRYETGGIL